MPTQTNMEIDEPKEGDDGATVHIKSPPKMKRASRDIASTPGRDDNVSDEDGTNHVTPAKEEQKSTRRNQAPKRTKVVQSIESYFGKAKKNKEELCRHNAMTVVTAHRTEGGEKLVPAGLRKQQREERARKSRKEAAEVDGCEESDKTISFGASNGNNKTAAPQKSALKNGKKEKLKTYKHELVVEVRLKVNYTKGKGEVRKQVYKGLGETLGFI